MQSIKSLFDQNKDCNTASQVVQLNHGEVSSEDTSEVLYSFHKVYFKV